MFRWCDGWWRCFSICNLNNFLSFTNYFLFKMGFCQIIPQTALRLCSHFFLPCCYFTAWLLSNVNDSFPCAYFFSLSSCRNCSQTCPMICWMTVETPPPQSWSTPPAAIKTLAAGNKKVEINWSSRLISHEEQSSTLEFKFDSLRRISINFVNYNTSQLFLNGRQYIVLCSKHIWSKCNNNVLCTTQPSISVVSAMASETKTHFPQCGMFLVYWLNLYLSVHLEA